MKTNPSRRAAARGALLLSACLALPGCFTFTHTVGRGPTGQDPVATTETQWFALWGLAPLDPVDSARLAGTARDYRVTTKFTVMDVVISAFSSFVTLYRQTVIVEK